MSLAACTEHQPMHRFGVGWVCGRCGIPVGIEGKPSRRPLNISIDQEWLKRKIQEEDEHEIGAGFELFPLPDQPSQEPPMSKPEAHTPGIMSEAGVTCCCGCGMRAINNVKPCACATMVGAYDDVDGQRRYVVLMSQEQADRIALSALIKTRLIGVAPDDQDLVLDDEDWMRIVAALEGSSNG